MAITYRKIDKDTVKRTVSRDEIIDLRSLRRRRKALKGQVAPSRKELIELGKMFHEYYTTRQQELESINKQIKELTNG